VGGGLDDPLNDLRRNSLALGVALRRRVPDWSPEAAVLKGRVDAILAATLDYEEISRRSLGSGWDNLTSAQQREFLETFSALTNQTFVAAMTRPDVHLRFDSETVMGQLASVEVTAWDSKLTPDYEQHIEYLLTEKRGRWLIYDVLVDHVSLVEGYRDQFARLMRRGGFSEIIDRMRRKQELAGRY
jgi:phospholipid transport system substrate-binding protein